MCVVERGEVVERGGGVGVLGAQRLLVDRERPLVQGLSLGVRAGGAVEEGEVVERGGGAGVLGAQRLLP